MTQQYFQMCLNCVRQQTDFLHMSRVLHKRDCFAFKNQTTWLAASDNMKWNYCHSITDLSQEWQYQTWMKIDESGPIDRVKSICEVSTIEFPTFVLLFLPKTQFNPETEIDEKTQIEPLSRISSKLNYEKPSQMELISAVHNQILYFWVKFLLSKGKA